MRGRHYLLAARVLTVGGVLALLDPVTLMELGLAAVALVLAAVPDWAFVLRWGRALSPRADAVPHDRANSAFGIGYTLLHAGKPSEAEEHLRNALAADPEDADARLNLGIALAEMCSHEEAIAELRQATELRPRDATAHYRLGVSLANVGQHFAAMHSLREAIRLDPNMYVAERAIAAVSFVAKAHGNGAGPAAPGTHSGRAAAS